MSIAITNITGTAQTGLTSPVYNVTADTAPDVNGKQYAITSLGGTQTGVISHSVGSPFTVTFWRAKLLRVLGQPNVNTGIINSVPMNTYKLVTRKGVIPLAGQPTKVCLVTTTFEVPAGSDTADSEDIRAAVSCHIGALSQQSAGIGDTLISGVM